MAHGGAPWPRTRKITLNVFAHFSFEDIGWALSSLDEPWMSTLEPKMISSRPVMDHSKLVRCFSLNVNRLQLFIVHTIIKVGLEAQREG